MSDPLLEQLHLFLKEFLNHLNGRLLRILYLEGSKWEEDANGNYVKKNVITPYFGAALDDFKPISTLYSGLLEKIKSDDALGHAMEQMIGSDMNSTRFTADSIIGNAASVIELKGDAYRIDKRKLSLKLKDPSHLYHQLVE